MIAAALFTIAKEWKPLKCPSTGEEKNKMCYIHTTDYYPALKGKLHVTAWVTLKSMMLSGKSQTQKVAYCITALM